MTGIARNSMNGRQAKATERMFRECPDEFKGDLSAENYISITETSRATATRDLQDLVEKGAVTRTGARRYTRYWLNLHRTPANLIQQGWAFASRPNTPKSTHR